MSAFVNVVVGFVLAELSSMRLYVELGSVSTVLMAFFVDDETKLDAVAALELVSSFDSTITSSVSSFLEPKSRPVVDTRKGWFSFSLLICRPGEICESSLTTRFKFGNVVYDCDCCCCCCCC